MDSAQTLETIRELLGNGDTEDAANLLLALAKESHKEHYNSALLLKNRLETLQHNSIEGVLSLNEERLEWAKISKSIVGLAEQIERNEAPRQQVVEVASNQNATATTQSGQGKKTWWWALAVLLLLGVALVPNLFQKKGANAAEKSEARQAPLQKMQGQVIYFDGKPAANATLAVEYLGKTFTAAADANGKFTLEVDSSSLFKQVNFRVAVDGKEKTETIRLVPENLSLYTLPR